MAFARWRNILVNWISCFDGGTDWQLQPSDALDRIILQLRGSSLDVQTVDGFILDKYPDFKFENRTSRPSTDEDICMAASLLLLYMCVRSKDVDLKNAMCSKLSREDQEVILKFTKCLMNRTPVTYGDVRTAILECTSAEFPCVAECAGAGAGAGAGTPPPLRALHGEVRRLRAALDAERFDRAYLQDELLATAGKLDKLLKDKEQHQKEILSLKSQLSERQNNLDTTDPGSPERESVRRQFARQMSTLEERLVDTQGLLDECERARDALKSKIDEMKLDRDKWVEFGQLESVRACDLAEQLDAEKKTSSSLREMLNELHAHNKLNHRDDSSFLECDDTDSPRSRSFVHDSSVCGDVCAGVVEVQLCEERARVAALSQDLHALQDKVKKLEDALMVKEEEILLKSDQIENEIKLRGKMEAMFNKQRTDILTKLDENLNIIQNSTAKVEELNCEKEFLEKKVSESEKIIISNETNIEELKIENAHLNAMYEEAMREFNAEKNSLENIMTEIKNTVTKYEAELNLLRRKHAESEENVIVFTVKIEELKSKNDCLQKIQVELDSTIASQQVQIEQLQKDYVKLKSHSDETVKLMGVKITQFKTEKSEIEKSLMNCEKMIIDNELQLTQLQDTIARMEQTIQLNNVDIENLEEEKKTLQTKQTELTDIITFNEYQITLLRNENTENKRKTENTIEEMYIKIQNLEEARENFEKKIIAFENAIAQLQNENILLKDEAVEISHHFNGIIDTLKKEKECLEMNVSEYENVCASNKLKMEKLQEENIQNKLIMEETLKIMSHKIEELQKDNCLLEEKIIHCTNIIATNETQISQLENEAVQMKAGYEDSIRRVNVELEELKTESISLEKKLIEYENMIISDQAQIAELQNENENNLKEKHIIFEELTAKINELEVQKQLIEKKYIETADIIACTELKMDQFEKDNTKLKLEAEESLKLLTAKVNELKAHKELLEKKNIETADTVACNQLKMDQLEGDNSKLMTKLKELETQKELHEKNNIATADIISSNKLKIYQLEEDNSKLKLQAEESVKLLLTKLNELETQKELLEKKNIEIADIVACNQLEMDQLDEDNSKLKLQAEESVKLLMTKLNELETQKELIEKKNIEIADIVACNQLEMDQLERDNSKLTTKLNELETQKELLEKKNIETADIMSCNKLKIDQLEEDNSKLKLQAEESVKLLTTTLNELETQKELLEKKNIKTADIMSCNKLKIDQLEEDNSKLKLQAEESVKLLTIKLNKLETQKELLEKKHIETADIVACNKFKIDQLEEDNSKFTTKLNEMETQKHLLEKKNIAAADIIACNQLKMDQLEKENSKLKLQAEESVKLLTAKVNELETRKELLQKKNIEIANIMACNQLKMNQLEEENVELKSELEDISKLTALEIAELKTNKQILEKQTTECENINKSIQMEIRQLENENAQLKSKVDDISKLCDEANRLNNVLTMEHNESNKALNDLINKVNLGNLELENKISEQCNELSNLVEENKELGNNAERIKEVLETVCQSIDKVLLSENPNSAEMPFIDISEEKIEKTLNMHIKNLKNFIQNSISEKSILEKCISELKSNIKATDEEVYSIKLKLKIIISQNNGYLDTMIKDTDLFENKYGFVNVTQETCNVPNANNSFEQFVTAVESILSRHKMIANVFKTEYKSLSETHKKVLMEKENVSEGVTTARKDYEKRLRILNDQLLDKKALVSHLEKDITDMQNDKNAIINNLSDQLEKAKIENIKVSKEIKVPMEELKCKLEEGNKAREDIILKKDEEKKEFIEQIEALQTELRSKNKELEHKLKLEKYITTLRTNITDMVKLGFPDSQENYTVILPNNSENIVAVNLLRQPSAESTTSGIVKSLCDEEKIKSISSDDPELANLQSFVEGLLQQTALAMKALNEANTKLEDALNKNNKLQSELLAKSSLVHSLEQDIANVELKFDDVNTEFKNIKEKDLILTELLETKESHLKASDAKLMALETVIAEKEELVKDLNNNLVTVTTERNSLKENLHAKDDAVRQIIQQLNVLMDSFESNGSATFEDTFQNIETLLKSFSNESVLKLLPLLRFKGIFSTISELKDRNEILNIKCQELELEMNSKIKVLANEVAVLSESIANREDLVNDVRATKEKDVAELQMQVHMLSTDLIGTSEERNQTISNLEKIVYDKNRTITTLQGDITYLKSLVAESEYKLLDVTKELEQYKENCQQLSSQLKRSVNLKNEEISSLKKQLSKISSHENSASQIIKVSAKYQAIILKRIAEIKSNTVLRELSQFTNVDGDKRKSLASGTVTIDQLENFLEGTEKHLRKLVERQSTLQKERDTIAEVSKINESETISLKKYLTELLAHFKTFTSVKEVYNQKLSQVISKQRMIRREIHSLDQNIPEGVMYKLERSYGIVMQDLCETALNLGRWAERCIDRSISPEKLKQAFASDAPSLSTSHFQNTGLEVQIEELMMAFKKVYEEVQKAKSMECSKPDACNVMEVRAEYEDKLNRMKAKMKQLYHEQMSACQSKQEAELERLRRRLEDKSKAYEEHIQGLTRELWSVGEKLLVKKEEAEWLQRRQPSSSLMSLQHVHSSGLGPPPREGREPRRDDRPADTQSLHGVPAHKPKSEGRGFHMSDEEGEVFDNRWLKELETPPRPEREGRRATGAGAAGAAGTAGRISELKYRNSLCPPHLKSSYPAETHYAAGAGVCHEDDIKFEGAAGGAERRGRKEVGIIAYKKPGPPTPSKNAGRLSATDSELRESLRSAAETPVVRKTTTPSRLRALFRSNRSDAENTATPRSRRLSIFRKKQ